MSAFLSGLGAAVGDYAQQRLERRGIGRAISQGVNRYRAAQNQAQAGMNPQSPANQMDRSPVANPTMPPQQDMQQPDMQQPMDDGGGEPLGMDAFGEGRLVTRPTIALLGDQGPERVVALNSDPNNKTNAPVIPRYRGRI